MELQRIRNRIQEILTHWVGLINAETNYGQNDKKVISEVVLTELLAEVFGYTELKTLNADSGFNYPGIDLGDTTARVAIQVTATPKPNKIIHTIEEFLKHKQYQQFDRLVVYILTQKQSSYSGKKLEAKVQELNQHIHFDLKRDVWDWRAVHNRVAGFTAEQAQRVLDILEANITGQPTPREIPVRTLPEQYIPRQGKFAEVKARLLEAAQTSGKVGITGSVALRGAGGFGKTTLAGAVLADPEVTEAFPDGIWEVVLGEKAEEDSTVVWLNELIKQQTRHNPDFDKIASARDDLRKAIAGKRLLLFVDDAWHKEWLQPFCELGCPVLVTTRDARVLPKNALEVEVDHMTPEEAQELLGHGVGEGEWSQPENTARAELAKALGHWALLLSLVNISLKDYVRDGQTRLEAIHKIQERLRRKGITHFDGRNAQQREAAVALTMEVGLEHLGPELQAFGLDSGHYQQLAIFPPDQPIPLNVLERLWGTDAFDTTEVCSILHKRSLLSQYRSQTILLHDVTRHYLEHKNRATLPQWHGQLLERIKPPSGRWADLPHENTYAWQWLAHHLHEAGQTDGLEATVFDFDFLQNKLLALGSVNALLADLERLPSPEARVLRQTLQRSGHVLQRHPEQLAFQLVGRLLGHHLLGAREVFNTANTRLQAQGLKPLQTRPYLSLPEALEQTLEGHTSWVSALAALPDGRVVSGSNDETLRVWDLERGTSEVLNGHTNWVSALAALPDGRVVSGSDDRTLRVWDLERGTSEVLEGHTYSVKALAALPDGRVVSGLYDGTLQVWNLERGTSEVLQGHTDPVSALAALPGGRVVSGSWDFTLRVWDLERGTSKVLEGHTGSVNALAALPNGRVVSGSVDQTLRVWNLERGTSAVLKGHTDWVTSLAALPDGRVVSGSSDETLWVWDLERGTSKVLERHTDPVSALAALPDGRVVSGSDDGTLRVWDFERGTSEVFEGYTDWVTALAALPNGRVVSGSYDGTLRVWNLELGNSQQVGGHTGSVTALAALPGGRVVSGSTENSLRVWDLERGTSEVLDGHTNWMFALAVLPSGRVVSGSSDRTLRVWDLERGTSEVLEGHTDWVRALVTLSDGRVVSGSEDFTLRVWDLERCTSAVLKGHTDWVTSLAALPDGRVVSGSSDETLRVWDLERGTSAVLKGHSRRVNALATLPDGRVVSGSSDRTLRVWDTNTARTILQVELDSPIVSLTVGLLRGGVTLSIGTQRGDVVFFQVESKLG